MFIPRWVVILLFLVAIGSTTGLLVVLSQKSGISTMSPSPTSTVLVTESASPALIASPSASTSGLLASAEWKKYSSSNLSLQFEYPSTWSVAATDSAQIVVSTATASATVTKDLTTISVVREKKSSSKDTLASFSEKTQKSLKEAQSSLKIEESTSQKVDDYDSLAFTTQLDSASTKYVVFATKNYFYTITIAPAASVHSAAIDDLLKTVKII